MLLCSLFAKKFQYLTPNQQLQNIHIHHNGEGHFVTSSNLTNKVKLYDSLNTKPATELLKLIFVILLHLKFCMSFCQLAKVGV